MNKNENDFTKNPLHNSIKINIPVEANKVANTNKIDNTNKVTNTNEDEPIVVCGICLCCYYIFLLFNH